MLVTDYKALLVETKRWLKNGSYGDWVEENGRRITVENMAGGRYLLTEAGEVAGQTNSEQYALEWMTKGENR